MCTYVMCIGSLAYTYVGPYKLLKNCIAGEVRSPSLPTATGLVWQAAWGRAHSLWLRHWQRCLPSSYRETERLLIGSIWCRDEINIQFFWSKVPCAKFVRCLNARDEQHLVFVLKFFVLIISNGTFNPVVKQVLLKSESIWRVNYFVPKCFLSNIFFLAWSSF